MTDTPQDSGPEMPADEDNPSTEKLRKEMRRVADEVDQRVEQLKPRLEKTGRDLWGRLRGKPSQEN